MSLADELKQRKIKCHKVWFERWYANLQLEKTLKIEADKGEGSYMIVSDKVDSEYSRSRIFNELTAELLGEKLGEGFEIRTGTAQREHVFQSPTNVEIIIISWE
ncbi:hypothetical protein BG261_02875 [Floricoccus tropicus]|uniref:Uncharacterized protein n=1 Tax=Floricoccus tropicus TaxID=1859473 RepID=A0A1E8GMR3_9LACT|nr:hypothetical protein [Floricoccus tropicus]OFI49539.1 hypothetical protein BG261_02875 [Floricoccus tropicus]